MEQSPLPFPGSGKQLQPPHWHLAARPPLIVLQQVKLIHADKSALGSPPENWPSPVQQQREGTRKLFGEPSKAAGLLSPAAADVSQMLAIAHWESDERGC